MNFTSMEVHVMWLYLLDDLDGFVNARITMMFPFLNLIFLLLLFQLTDHLISNVYDVKNLIILPSCVNNGIFNPNETSFPLFHYYETACGWIVYKFMYTTFFFWCEHRLVAGIKLMFINPL